MPVELPKSADNEPSGAGPLDFTQAPDSAIPQGLYAGPSEAVIDAAEQVKIAENRVVKRRLDREAEEVEDWFRERRRQQVAEAETARQKAAAAQVEQRRRAWLDKWTQHALEAVPSDAPRESRLEVHGEVQAALRSMDGTKPDGVTKRLVDAAIDKALAPWRRKEEIRQAMETALSALPFVVRHGSDHAALRQRAWEAAATAIRRISEYASSREMVQAGVSALQPMMREYEHAQACERALLTLYVPGGSWEEQAEAKEAARRALTTVPTGATQKEIEKTRDAAVAPFVTRIARRKEAERVEAETQSRKRIAEWKIAGEIGHIDTYLQEAYEFDGGYPERFREAARLRRLIEPRLVQELMESQDVGGQTIRNRIEELIDDQF